jgi:hypothetical protein
MLPVQSVRKINLDVFAVNGIRGNCLCKSVHDCGKKERREDGSKFKEKRKKFAQRKLLTQRAKKR